MKAIHSLASLSVLLVVTGLTEALPSYSQSGDAGRRMWVIFAREEYKNSKPGTWGAEIPIMEWYYDAGSVRSIGSRRFAEINFCGYKRWKPEEPRTGQFLCKLEDNRNLPNIVGIDCKSNTFQNASGLLASPKWEKIKSDFQAKLKQELCSK